MRDKLEIFYWLLFRLLLKKFLKQGYQHENNLINIHRGIHDALAAEFYEDTETAREGFDFLCRAKAWTGV